MSEQKVIRQVVVTNQAGIHARPADLLVKLASRFQCKVELVKGHERIDGKSILAILTLVAGQGTTLSIEADGPDAEAAVEALAQLFAQNFAESEEADAG